MRWILAGIAVLLVLGIGSLAGPGQPAQAQRPRPKYAREKRDPIDVEMDQRLLKAQSTLESVQAIEHAQQRWDAELNRAYNRLMRVLPPDQSHAVRIAQRAWLKYRDAEFDAGNSIIGSWEGSAYNSVQVGHRMKVVRDRVLLLRGLIPDTP